MKCIKQIWLIGWMRILCICELSKVNSKGNKITSLNLYYIMFSFSRFTRPKLDDVHKTSNVRPIKALWPLAFNFNQLIFFFFLTLSIVLRGRACIKLRLNISSPTPADQWEHDLNWVHVRRSFEQVHGRHIKTVLTLNLDCVSTVQ